MKKKISIFNKLRNYFIAGIVAIIPIGITLYLTMFIIDVSSKLVPKEINPNNYLPFSIPGLEIILSIIIMKKLIQKNKTKVTSYYFHHICFMQLM